MKRLSVVLAVVGLFACTGEPVLNTEPAVTAKGDPTGSAVSATIGASGGTLKSGDGKLELVVPAGAVSGDTMFTATPLSVTAPGGFAAYRLGPEGTTFAQPVSIRFSASSTDLAGSEAAALRIAYQDSAGSWRAFDDATLEGNTITVKTRHLSDWSMLIGWQLRPPSANVKLGGSQTLSVRYCNTTVTDPGTDGELVSLVATCQDSAEELAPILGVWAVNGTPNGSASIGTVAPGSPSATYTAPDSEPSPNPVAVSVEFNPPVKNGKKTLLVSNITVGGKLPRSYMGTFQYHQKYGGPGTNIAYEEVRGSGQVSFVPWPEQGPYKYKMSGTFTLTSLALDLANCDCTASSGSGSLEDQDNSLSVLPEGIVKFGWSTSMMVGLSCTKKTPSANCVTTYPFGASWSLTSIDTVSCSGSVMNAYTDPKALSGSWTQSCATSNGVEEITWTFTGAD